VLQRSLGVWTTLVLIFLFIPVGLVFLHSFNRGNSFTIFANAVSTKWWGELFDGAMFFTTALRFAVFIGAAVIAKRLLTRRALFGRAAYTVWIVPGAFALALVINGLLTSWYATIFDFAGVGDAIRNSFIAAFGATVIAVALGGTSGVALARRPGAWSNAFMVVVFLILVTPEIMDAIALATWFPRIQDVTSSPKAGDRSMAASTNCGSANHCMHQRWSRSSFARDWRGSMSRLNKQQPTSERLLDARFVKSRCR
jgi:ABC-type spermidine/putrescine transport system permease subunit II